MTENNSNPDRAALIAFVIAVIVLGVNFVAVRFSNQELPPFWGASLRFLAATMLLFGIVRWRKLPLPRGRALTGAVLFGLFSFAISYAFLYWGLTRVSSGMASVLFATIPLMTQLIASLIGQERLTWRGMLGALIVIVGIAIVFMEQLRFDVPFVYMGAVLLGVLSSALSGIVVKQYPKSHPVSTNVVGMGIGAVLLLLLSIFAGESQGLPVLSATWLALGWLIFSSIVGFVLIVWLLSRWSATATSYIGVLTPIVTVAVASVLAAETPTLTFLAGSLFVLLGVYVGALSPQQAQPARSIRADS
ncbi:MAG TPA: EamA family transporter [Anaerolineales bacterium]|nr:EamA family transporter [Anaerolineales bacterium]